MTISMHEIVAYSSRRVVGVTLLALLQLAACGDDTGSGGTGATAGDGTGATGGMGSGGTNAGGSGTGGNGGTVDLGDRPPEPGPLVPPDGTGNVTFAISKLFLGGTDRSGVASTEAWKSFGYDIDGKNTGENSTDTCKPRDNAPPKSLVDGDNGIDNSYGRNILPIITALSTDTESAANDSIRAGGSTLLFALEKLGAGAGYNPLIGRVYGSLDLEATPKYDGTDAFPVDASTLNNPLDVASAKVTLSDSYLVGNVWVGKHADVNLRLQLNGISFMLPIRNATITMELNAAHDSAPNGTISGVIPTGLMETEFVRLGASLDASLCESPTLESILVQIRQGSDIMADGSQDPNKTCDGISIGLGFEASSVVLGSIDEPPVPANPCEQYLATVNRLRAAVQTA